MRNSILLFACIFLICFACEAVKSEDRILSEMKSPVIVVGKSSIEGGINAHHWITVKDSSGRIETFYGALGKTLQHFNHNDTIK